MRAIHGHGRWFLNVIALTVYMLAASVRAAFGVEAVLSDDAHRFSSEPASNFGASPILVIRGGAATFLRFDFSTLPPVTGAAVEKATMTVFVNRVRSPGSLDVALVASAWDEMTITSENAPPLVSTGIPSTPIGAGDVNAYVAVDITALVQAWLDSPSSNFGIALIPASKVNVHLDSKENTSK